MNKKKFNELPILTPFRTCQNGKIYVRLPLHDGNGLACNAYCIEDKNSVFISPWIKVNVVNLIMEEI